MVDYYPKVSVYPNGRILTSPSLGGGGGGGGVSLTDVAGIIAGTTNADQGELDAAIAATNAALSAQASTDADLQAALDALNAGNATDAELAALEAALQAEQDAQDAATGANTASLANKADKSEVATERERITNLHEVARSGDYADLENKPAAPDLSALETITDSDAKVAAETARATAAEQANAAAIAQEATDRANADALDEKLANKVNDFATINDTTYPTTRAVNDRFEQKLPARSPFDILREKSDGTGLEARPELAKLLSQAIKKVKVGLDLRATGTNTLTVAPGKIYTFNEAEQVWNEALDFAGGDTYKVFLSDGTEVLNGPVNYGVLKPSYDLNGVLSPIPGNDAVTSLVYIEDATGELKVLLGQIKYGSYASAATRVDRALANMVVPPLFATGHSFLGTVTVGGDQALNGANGGVASSSKLLESAKVAQATATVTETIVVADVAERDALTNSGDDALAAGRLVLVLDDGEGSFELWIVIDAQTTWGASSKYHLNNKTLPDRIAVAAGNPILVPGKRYLTTGNGFELPPATGFAGKDIEVVHGAGVKDGTPAIVSGANTRRIVNGVPLPPLPIFPGMTVLYASDGVEWTVSVTMPPVNIDLTSADDGHDLRPGVNYVIVTPAAGLDVNLPDTFAGLITYCLDTDAQGDLRVNQVGGGPEHRIVHVGDDGVSRVNNVHTVTPDQRATVFRAKGSPLYDGFGGVDGKWSVTRAAVGNPIYYLDAGGEEWKINKDNVRFLDDAEGVRPVAVLGQEIALSIIQANRADALALDAADFELLEVITTHWRGVPGVLDDPYWLKTKSVPEATPGKLQRETLVATDNNYTLGADEHSWLVSAGVSAGATGTLPDLSAHDVNNEFEGIIVNTSGFEVMLDDQGGQLNYVVDSIRALRNRYIYRWRQTGPNFVKVWWDGRLDNAIEAFQADMRIGNRHSDLADIDNTPIVTGHDLASAPDEAYIRIQIADSTGTARRPWPIADISLAVIRSQSAGDADQFYIDSHADGYVLCTVVDYTTGALRFNDPNRAVNYHWSELRVDGDAAAVVPTGTVVAAPKTAAVTSPSATAAQQAPTIYDEFFTAHKVEVAPNSRISLDTVTDAIVFIVSETEGYYNILSTGPNPAVTFVEFPAVLPDYTRQLLRPSNNANAVFAALPELVFRAGATGRQIIAAATGANVTLTNCYSHWDQNVTDMRDTPSRTFTNAAFTNFAGQNIDFSVGGAVEEAYFEFNGRSWHLKMSVDDSWAINLLELESWVL